MRRPLVSTLLPFTLLGCHAARDSQSTPTPSAAITAPDSEAEVYVGGQVRQPGPYALVPGMTFAELIRRAVPANVREDTQVDLTRRTDSRQEEFHRYTWAQVQDDGSLILRPHDAISVGPYSDGPSEWIIIDHRPK